MATRTVPKILGEAVEAGSPWSRSSRHRHRTPPINRTNGGGQSVVARAQDSWRAENARHRHLRAYRLPHSAKAPPAAYPDLEDFPAHPCRANRIDRLFYRADDHDEGVFVFIVLGHGRRQVLHFNVTEHPTAAWTAQQIVEAFADREPARYLLRDRDGIYGNEVRLRINSLGMEEVLTAPQSPWQNPYAEGLIGSIRREGLSQYISLNARHLKRTLSCYFRYYHNSRTHLSLSKQCPF